MIAFLKKLRALFPFTAPGLIIAAASAFAFFFYGMQRIDLILLGVGVVGLGVTGLSLLFTVTGAFLLSRSIRGLPERDAVRLECGYWAETGFSVPSLWYLPLIGSESFFDGFGFQQPQLLERFPDWQQPSPLDERELARPPRRPPRSWLCPCRLGVSNHCVDPARHPIRRPPEGRSRTRTGSGPTHHRSGWRLGPRTSSGRARQ